jgi:hypothetical protein
LAPNRRARRDGSTLRIFWPLRTTQAVIRVSRDHLSGRLFVTHVSDTTAVAYTHAMFLAATPLSVLV